MWAYAMILALVSAFAFWLAGDEDDARTVDASRSRALAESMATYRAAVVEMARAQPGFEGPVRDDALTLPDWWRSRPELRATVAGKMVAVYLGEGADRAGVLQEMLRLAAGSILVGLADRASGTLHSPSLGDTGIALPPEVPDGAPVWLATRD